MNRTTLNWLLGIVSIILLVIAPFWLNNSPYLMHIAISPFFYVILASSWSLLAGYAGQFSFGHMAFMAIGTYTAALLEYYVKFTTAQTNECTEFALGGIWLVLLNQIGVSSSRGNSLEVAKATMPAGMVIWSEVLPCPVHQAPWQLQLPVATSSSSSGKERGKLPRR